MSEIVSPTGHDMRFEAHILKSPGIALPVPKHIRLKEFLALPETESQKFVIDSGFSRELTLRRL